MPGTTRYVGPYEPWQVVGLVLSLAALAAVAGWLEVGKLAAAATTVAVTVTWSADAATQTAEDASLWPIGAVLVFVGAAIGLSLVALIAHTVHRTVRRD